MHFNKADRYIDFYVLFTLWSSHMTLMKVRHSMLSQGHCGLHGDQYYTSQIRGKVTPDLIRMT